MALIRYVEVKIGKWVNNFQSNGGGKYFSRWFAKHLKLKSIYHKLTNPDTS